MEEIIGRIKDYALVIKSDLSDNESLLDFVVKDVVNRAMAFMNRVQLKAAYEEDNTKPSPIPEELETVLASIVVSCFKNTTNLNTAEVGAIKSISDNGQSISYSEQVTNFLTSTGDSEIFSGSEKLLRRYLLPTIPEYDNTSYI